MPTTQTVVTFELDEIKAAVNKAVTPKSFESHYQVAKLVNSAIANLGLKRTDGKSIPPQMVYTYMTKGYIKGQTADAVSTWLQKYLGNNISKFAYEPPVETIEGESDAAAEALADEFDDLDDRVDDEDIVRDLENESDNS